MVELLHRGPAAGSSNSFARLSDAVRGVISLTDAANVQPDAASGQNVAFTWLMGASRTLTAPTNPVEMQIIRVAIKPSGAWSVTLSGFIGSSDYQTGTIALASGKWTTFTFQYISDIGWQYVGKTTSGT